MSGVEKVDIEMGSEESFAALLVRNGHLEAAAVALAGASDVPSAMDLLKDGSKASALRAIEDYLATFPTAEDYLAMEP